MKTNSTPLNAIMIDNHISIRMKHTLLPTNEGMETVQQIKKNFVSELFKKSTYSNANLD